MFSAVCRCCFVEFKTKSLQQKTYLVASIYEKKFQEFSLRNEVELELDGGYDIIVADRACDANVCHPTLLLGNKATLLLIQLVDSVELKVVFVDQHKYELNQQNSWIVDGPGFIHIDNHRDNAQLCYYNAKDNATLSVSFPSVSKIFCISKTNTVNFLATLDSKVSGKHCFGHTWVKINFDWSNVTTTDFRLIPLRYCDIITAVLMLSKEEFLVATNHRQLFRIKDGVVVDGCDITLDHCDVIKLVNDLIVMLDKEEKRISFVGSSEMKVLATWGGVSSFATGFFPSLDGVEELVVIKDKHLFLSGVLNLLQLLSPPPTKECRNESSADNLFMAQSSSCDIFEDTCLPQDDTSSDMAQKVAEHLKGVENRHKSEVDELRLVLEQKENLATKIKNSLKQINNFTSTTMETDSSELVELFSGFPCNNNPQFMQEDLLRLGNIWQHFLLDFWVVGVELENISKR